MTKLDITRLLAWVLGIGLCVVAGRIAGGIGGLALFAALLSATGGMLIVGGLTNDE